MRPGGATGLPVAWYLRPEEAVVPFRDRPELGELLGWCTGGGRRAEVRLLTGNGGAGKTRLALRLGQELNTCGWHALWVPRGAEREAASAVRTVGEPSVLVVDYAETRADLAGLVADVAGNDGGPEVRVVLLARSAGEWWDQLVRGSEWRAAALLETHAPLILGPVRAAGGSQEIFTEALAAFADRLGTACPDTPLTVTDPDPVILVVHAAALLAVADHLAGRSPGGTTNSGETALEGLLRHEAGYWVRSAAGRGLDLDVSVLRLAVAVACLIGAGNQTDAVDLLARVPDLDSAERRGQVARWLHDLYPTPTRDGDAPQGEWLGPLRPDRLAEQLVAGELAGRPELARAWFTGLNEGRATRALTVLARAALTQQRAAPLLRVALAADLDQLAVPALAVAIETSPVLGDLLAQVLAGKPTSRETLQRIAAKSPYPSFALAAPAATALQSLADDPIDPIVHAGTLVDLSYRLGDLGRREEALEKIGQAAEIYRQHADDLAPEWLPDLANALSRKSVHLTDLGRRDEALETSEQAVAVSRNVAALGRQLSNERPGAGALPLASSLNNHSRLLADFGRHQEALEAIGEAAAIYIQVTANRPSAYRPDLAGTLINKSVHLLHLGRHQEALETIEQAAGIYRQLAAERPDAYLPHLATALNNQSVLLRTLGRHQEALEAIEHAVTIRRRLAAVRPGVFTPRLVQSLNNLADTLSVLGRDADATTARAEGAAAMNTLNLLAESAKECD